MGVKFSANYHPAMTIPTSIGRWLANIFLIYPGLNPVTYDVRLSPPSWALSIELLFYLLIGLGALRTKLTSIIMFILGSSSVAFSVVQGTGMGYGTLYEAALPFSVGGLIFHYQIYITDLVKNWPKHLFAGISFLLLISNIIFALLVEYKIESSTFGLANWKVSTLCTLFNILASSLVIVALYNLKTNNINLKRIDRFLGDLSYPLYIFHTTAAAAVVYLVFSGTITEPAKTSFPVFVIALIFTLIVCIIGNVVLNKPIELIRERVKMMT
jgi:peptidoglycan/LPS O-acetylase OafA/YrhL